MAEASMTRLSSSLEQKHKLDILIEILQYHQQYLETTQKMKCRIYMTLKAIIMNGQLRRATLSIEWLGGDVTTVFPVATLAQPVAGTAAIRPVRAAALLRVVHFM